MIDDLETKMEVKTPYELLKDDQKKQLRKKNKANMTLYNALPRKKYERVFMCKTAKKFSFSSKETIDSGITRFNAIVTSLKSLDQDYSSKNHVRKFLRALQVYQMILENDGLASKTTKEKVKSLALKAKVNREQTSDDSDIQGGSDEDVDEEEAESFNLMARNFQKFLSKSFGNKGGGSSRQRRGCYNCGKEGHFIGVCPKPKENKAFVGRSWSDSEDCDEPENDATCLMVVDSKEVQPKSSTSNNNIDLFELQNENEEFLRFNKDFTKTFKEKMLS
ncbi:copia protein [Tanacetum coccineum]